MKTIDEIRHENLLLLIGKFGTVQALANAVGKSHAQISQLKTRAVHSATGKPRTIGDDLARTFEQRCDLPLGWFDNPHTSIDAEGPDHHQQQSTPAPLDLPQRSAHPDPHIRKAIAILEGLDREGRIEALGAIKVVAASHHRTASRSAG
ncbi:hypothetical protein [Cupriavidus malaysiensis]|uniref:XRE family transcriptional regulator n=1 Tax=Cupriavidus malaysiensis TaxID=367825 RepID=A0ABN4TFM3_9BURK|nr:hypothetical protein [Cupriavidus malaysiensis]AOZ05947.1 hypothetical protein BKK80_08995 [Cupriavidus malaysiensis]